MAEMTHTYRWDRCGRKGQECRLLVSGGRNTVYIEFADGFRMLTGRYGLRRLRAGEAR